MNEGQIVLFRDNRSGIIRDDESGNMYNFQSSDLIEEEDEIFREGTDVFFKILGGEAIEVSHHVLLES